MNIYEDLRPLRARLSWWRALLIFLFAALLIRFWQLQVVRATRYEELAHANHVRPIPESAPRGLIVDRYGRIIAENRPSFNLTLEEERRDTLEALRELIPLEEHHLEVEQQLKDARLGGAILKEDIPLEEVARVEARQLELPGAHIQFVPRRYYPAGARASHLVGYVGRMAEDQLQLSEFQGAKRNDYVGQSGVERIYNQLLMGRNGVQRVVVNSHGRRERVLDQVPPVWGESVQLSVDLDLQQVAEEAFADASGAVVAIDPRSGQVLVMGSFPAYDPNFFSGRFEHQKWIDLVNDEKHPLSNRAIQGRYAPGSTFKLVVAAAALEQDLVTADTQMTCQGSVRMYGNVFHCHKAGGHGRLSLVQALAQSCNSYFFQLGAKLQIEAIARYGRLFGLGAPTGIDLPHEVSGLIPDPDWKKQARNEPWYAGETISVAVGQGSVLVTTLQMARLAAIVGTSGDVQRPRMFLRNLPVGEVPSPYPDGELAPPLRHVSLRESTWRALQEGMFQAVNQHGTAARARLQGIAVAGKTGTAQVASRQRISAALDANRPEHLRNHGWFVGFAPRVNPEIAIAVLVEHGGGGGATAAPIAQTIFQAYFDGQREARTRNGPRQTTMALH